MIAGQPRTLLLQKSRHLSPIGSARLEVFQVNCRQAALLLLHLSGANNSRIDALDVSWAVEFCVHGCISLESGGLFFGGGEEKILPIQS